MVDSKNYSQALERLRELLSTVDRDADIFISKDSVLRKFQPIFSHSQINSLRQEDLERFLHFRNNHHWTSLDRQIKNLISDLGTLRKALIYVTNETIPIDQRIDNMPKVKGLGLDILTPILMMSDEEKYGVWNSKTDKFFTDFNLIPTRNKSVGKFYEEVNSVLHQFSKDLNIGLWELDALFHYYVNMPEISKEIHRRIELFNSLKRDMDGYVSNNEISDKKIRYGQRGIISMKLLHLGEEAALSIFSNGKDYSDKLSENSLEYDAPNTSIKAKDENEISGMITAMNYAIPIFVVIGDHKNGSNKKVFLGLVKDYDGERRKFLIDLLDKFPGITDSGFGVDLNQTEDFNPYEMEQDDKKQLVKVRRNQTKFRYGVLKRYGTICSVCDFDIEEAIEAAHIIPKESKGTDDLRNGLPMCSNHHKLFDSNFFAFDEGTNVIVREGFNFDKLGILRTDLKHLIKLPHPEAMAKRKDIFLKSNKIEF